MAAWFERGARFPDEYSYRPMRAHKGRVACLLAVPPLPPRKATVGAGGSAVLQAVMGRVASRLLPSGRPAAALENAMDAKVGVGGEERGGGGGGGENA